MRGLTIFVVAALCAAASFKFAIGYSLIEAIEDPPIPGWDLFDKFLFDLVPTLLGEKKLSNENGTASEFRKFLLNDKEDPALNSMTMQELIAAAGFKQENYKAVADDGYITSLTRIVNPLADRRHLKWPPTLLLHGGTIDPTAYLFSSTILHHPEKFPRGVNNPPFTSWNRSLAFTLANNGHDVWLSETRGSNEQNMDHIQFDAIKSVLEHKNNDKNMTIGEDIQEIIDSFNYWSFSIDDIIEHEIKSHIDKICQVLASETHTNDKCKVNLFSFSLSTPQALGFLSTRPDYAKQKVHRFIMMAPTFYRKGLTPFLDFSLTSICPLIPNSVGVLIVYDFIFTGFRQLLSIPSIWKKFRYSGYKSFLNLIMGPSAKYNTMIEQNIMFHLLRAFGFKEAKQMCQLMKYNRLQKYDYGPEHNLQVYNSKVPPAYDISNLLIEPFLLVTATNDALATMESVDLIKSQINPKPYRHISAPGFSHMDLIAGVEVDKYVNLPILNFLDEFAEPWPSTQSNYKLNSKLTKEIGAKRNGKKLVTA